LLVYNNDSIGRDKLSLATAETPEGPWQRVTTLDAYTEEHPYQRFSYPAIVAHKPVAYKPAAQTDATHAPAHGISGQAYQPEATKLQAPDIHYQLLYTVERSFIKSVTFDAHWLDQQSSSTSTQNDVQKRMPQQHAHKGP
jgi:hypothetical protein